MLSVIYAKCRKIGFYAECCYAECHYVECLCVECHGAILICCSELHTLVLTNTLAYSFLVTKKSNAFSNKLFPE
jgi:hypothetical protein